ncbi:hypothetical protein [Methylorubrum extorquens]|uniref:hypothetical protein n=1 Tax=Methylorubrum extorquens TaxID=408 RepID=UPI002238553C|nr:hypothetical protein [Methylorubrum extorquens]UYW32648.1 hypothetical protein OKB92_00530 [Methylorubrum extorquens]
MLHESILVPSTRSSQRKDYYRIITVSRSAAIGKYWLKIELLHEGIAYPSATASNDFFMVEQLEAVPQEGPDGRCYALVTNPGPEPVLGTLCVAGDAQDMSEGSEIIVPPNQAIRIDVPSRDCWFLVFGNGSMLPLTARRSLGH